MYSPGGWGAGRSSKGVEIAGYVILGLVLLILLCGIILFAISFFFDFQQRRRPKAFRYPTQYPVAMIY